VNESWPVKSTDTEFMLQFSHPNTHSQKYLKCVNYNRSRTVMAVSY
jgi:hypothetical protein